MTTEIIDFIYRENTEIEKAQSECTHWMEVIEDLENMRNNPSVDAEELEEAIEEATKYLNEAEEKVIALVWTK